MAAKLKLANNENENAALYCARHQVFVEEEKYMDPKDDQRIFDFYDALPTTDNIIALVDDRIVGGVRVTKLSELGLPVDQFYDFSPHIPNNDTRVAAASQFFLLRQFRSNQYRLGFSLMEMCIYWAIKHQMRYLVAAINPVIAPLCRRMGMIQVGPKFYHEGKGLETIPMLQDLNHVREPFASMIKRSANHGDKEKFDREYYLAGEHISCFDKMDPRDFIVMDGRLSVFLDYPKNDSSGECLLTELGPGDKFKSQLFLAWPFQQIRLVADSKVEIMPIEKTPVPKRASTQWVFNPKPFEQLLDIQKPIMGLPLITMTEGNQHSIGLSAT